MNSTYKNLWDRFAQISRLQNISSILGWDEAVMMPRGAGSARNAEIAELSSLIQRLSIESEIGRWLEDVEVTDAWDASNLREMKRAYLWSTAVPVELNQRLVTARLECEQRWRELRAQNDWKTFLPLQSEVLKLTRESLAHVAEKQNLSIYDTALAKFSPGLTEAAVEKLFGEIKSFLPDMIAKGRDRDPVAERPRGNFSLAAQKALAREMMEAIGFSFENGRLDESHHPFCGGTARDVRVTTRYQTSEFLSAMMGVLHETGHALYEQNLPRAWGDQPVGAPMGMAIHESQSLFWEMQICRSPEFQHFAESRIREHLGPLTENPASLSAENLAKLNTQTAPGLIRVDADEVTYPAHVILRFELERDLLNEKLRPEDLPEAWDAKMQSYLGLSTRGNDRDGCMQDVHWPSGAFGYFPAYTFGAVIAAQLFDAFRQEHPNVGADIARGDFKAVHAWLGHKIWNRGSQLETLDLVRDAVGPLKAGPYRKHLETRFFS